MAIGVAGGAGGCARSTAHAGVPRESVSGETVTGSIAQPPNNNANMIHLMASLYRFLPPLRLCCRGKRPEKCVMLRVSRIIEDLDGQTIIAIDEFARMKTMARCRYAPDLIRFALRQDDRLIR